jgi:hypothetical protein
MTGGFDICYLSESYGFYFQFNSYFSGKNVYFTCIHLRGVL